MRPAWSARLPGGQARARAVPAPLGSAGPWGQSQVHSGPGLRSFWACFAVTLCSQRSPETAVPTPGQGASCPCLAPSPSTEGVRPAAPLRPLCPPPGALVSKVSQRPDQARVPPSAQGEVTDPQAQGPSSRAHRCWKFLCPMRREWGTWLDLPCHTQLPRAPSCRRLLPCSPEDASAWPLSRDHPHRCLSAPRGCTVLAAEPRGALASRGRNFGDEAEAGPAPSGGPRRGQRQHSASRGLARLRTPWRSCEWAGLHGAPGPAAGAALPPWAGIGDGAGPSVGRARTSFGGCGAGWHPGGPGGAGSVMLTGLLACRAGLCLTWGVLCRLSPPGAQHLTGGQGTHARSAPGRPGSAWSVFETSHGGSVRRSGRAGPFQG